MRRIWFASPGDPRQRTGGYLYNAQIIERLSARGFDVAPIRLADGFPAPSEADLADARRQLGSLAGNGLLVVDGLALGAFDAATLDALEVPLVALVHHPLCDEAGTSDAFRRQAFASERAALARAQQVIVSSPHTASALAARFDVPAQMIDVVEPGVVQPDGGYVMPAARGRGRPPRILSVGSLTPRKAHDVLISAVAELRDFAWEADIVGSPHHAPETADALAKQIVDAGLSTRIVLRGELDALSLVQLYRRADIFALATRHEGYGMVFSEAMTLGLPIVTCRVGAVPDTVPEQAGMLVPVDDPTAFAAALGRLLDDTSTWKTYARGAADIGAELPSWDDAADRFAAALGKVADPAECRRRGSREGASPIDVLDDAQVSGGKP
ncbi:MAG: glycosyltransferase family 4 protein [Pseudomonadota bacterium]